MQTASKLSWCQKFNWEVVYTLDKAGELINKCLKESCYEFESEVKYLTILIVKLSILLLLMNFQDNSANWLAWRPFFVDFDVENESVTESLQKKKTEENCKFTQST